MVQYEDHLKKAEKDWESRWENVQELINFASELEKDLPNLPGRSLGFGEDNTSDTQNQRDESSSERYTTTIATIPTSTDN